MKALALNSTGKALWLWWRGEPAGSDSWTLLRSSPSQISPPTKEQLRLHHSTSRKIAHKISHQWQRNCFGECLCNGCQWDHITQKSGEYCKTPRQVNHIWYCSVCSCYFCSAEAKMLVVAVFLTDEFGFCQRHAVQVGVHPHVVRLLESYEDHDALSMRVPQKGV